MSTGDDMFRPISPRQFAIRTATTRSPTGLRPRHASRELFGRAHATTSAVRAPSQVPRGSQKQRSTDERRAEQPPCCRRRHSGSCRVNVSGRRSDRDAFGWGGRQRRVRVGAGARHVRYRAVDLSVHERLSEHDDHLFAALRARYRRCHRCPTRRIVPACGPAETRPSASRAEAEHEHVCGVEQPSECVRRVDPTRDRRCPGDVHRPGRVPTTVGVEGHAHGRR